MFRKFPSLLNIQLRDPIFDFFKGWFLKLVKMSVGISCLVCLVVFNLNFSHHNKFKIDLIIGNL